MYTFLANIWKLITHAFRVFQFLGVIYFLFYIIFWLCLVAQVPAIYNYSELFRIPQDITYAIFKFFGLRFSPDYTLLRLDVLTSVGLTFIALLIYNLIFIPLGAIERFFIEKSFNKGEQGNNELR